MYICRGKAFFFLLVVVCVRNSGGSVCQHWDRTSDWFMNFSLVKRLGSAKLFIRMSVSFSTIGTIYTYSLSLSHSLTSDTNKPTCTVNGPRLGVTSDIKMFKISLSLIPLILSMSQV